MDYYNKPSYNNYKHKDGKTHRSLEYKARKTKNLNRIYKEVFGLTTLSKVTFLLYF